MEKSLKCLEKTALNERTLELLKYHNIETASQFLKENNKRLCYLTNLNEYEILKIKICLKKDCSDLLLDVFDLYKTNENAFKIIPTGIKSLDEILNGGLTYGNLIEICGDSSSGKTLLCLTIAVNLIKDYNVPILYIDTKNDFSALRFKEILNNYGLPQIEIISIMKKIRVAKLSKADHLMELLNKLLNDNNCYKFVIIDSLLSIFNSLKGDNSNEEMIFLTQVTYLMRRLINEQIKNFIVVNAISNLMVESDAENNSRESNLMKSTLGKYWESVPTLRLLIEQKYHESFCTDDNSVSCGINTNELNINSFNIINSERVIRILQSSNYESGKSCTVKADTKGIT